MDGTILNTFFTLIAAVAVMGVFFFFVKRYASSIRNSNSQIELNVLSKLSLQPKNHLFVVKAGSRILLLGVADKGITPIADLTGKIESNAQTTTENNPTSTVVKTGKTAVPSDDLSFKAFIKTVLSRQSN